MKSPYDHVRSAGRSKASDSESEQSYTSQTRSLEKAVPRYMPGYSERLKQIADRNRGLNQSQDPRWPLAE